ncbi:hypothetical protein GCM10019059_36010 [Camelimonas fluminis]|uniref:Uncharacterized protein n=1 Tax=Camelimonas fluminis TaxID=1576911 RepID=A0ABV7UHK9_9HYPH|nr:hypothetical protein [Camelimonas fluminis]GHE73232.1 hypothetical protein GCM10019059_36010 [Camelimonas fluminis]
MTLLLKFVDRRLEITVHEETLIFDAEESSIIHAAFEALDPHDVYDDPHFALHMERTRPSSDYVRINGRRITRASAQKLEEALTRLRPFIIDERYQLVVLTIETMH